MRLDERADAACFNERRPESSICTECATGVEQRGLSAPRRPGVVFWNLESRI